MDATLLAGSSALRIVTKIINLLTHTNAPALEKIWSTGRVADLNAMSIALSVSGKSGAHVLLGHPAAFLKQKGPEGSSRNHRALGNPALISRSKASLVDIDLALSGNCSTGTRVYRTLEHVGLGSKRENSPAIRTGS